MLKSDPGKPIIAMLLLRVIIALLRTHVLLFLVRFFLRFGARARLFPYLATSFLLRRIVFAWAGNHCISSCIISKDVGIVRVLHSIDLVEAGLFGILQPVTLLVCFPNLRRFLNLLNEVVGIGHLFFLIIPLGQTKVLIHHDNVTRLLVFEEQGIGEEDFAT